MAKKAQIIEQDKKIKIQDFYKGLSELFNSDYRIVRQKRNSRRKNKNKC